MLNGEFFTQNICVDLFSVEVHADRSWEKKIYWFMPLYGSFVIAWTRYEFENGCNPIWFIDILYIFFIRMQTTSHKISNLNIRWALKKSGAPKIFIQMVWSIMLHSEIGEFCAVFWGSKLSLKWESCEKRCTVNTWLWLIFLVISTYLVYKVYSKLHQNYSKIVFVSPISYRNSSQWFWWWEKKKNK